MKEYIFYTGEGAKHKNGKHSIKEFIEIANKHFKMDCSLYLPEITYKPCIDKNKMLNKERNYRKRKNISLFKYKRSKKRQTKFNQLKYKCNSYKKNSKKRDCTLEEYIKYSGANN